jgi:ketosteroid isomerase-like protein
MKISIRDKFNRSICKLAGHKKTTQMKFMFVIMFAVTFYLPTFAQSNDQDQVVAKVEDLRKAMIGADKNALEKLTAVELSYGHSNGMIEDKQTFIDALLKGRSAFKTIILSDQTVRICGDIALVRHRLQGDTNNDNVPGKIDLFVLLIWQKQDGQWKLLARQSVKNPAQSN